MDELLDRLIADSQERALPALTARTVKLPWISGKVDAVIGMRRAGKTWFQYQVMGELIAQGLPRQAVLYLSFDDERLSFMTAEDLHRVADVFYRRHPENRDRTCAFFFDEIQAIPGWELFVRRMVDTEDVHVCLGGSSAKLLSREIATSLRGRAIATEIFPFSFEEAQRHAGRSRPLRVPGKRVRSELERATRRYLMVGGFPEVQALDEPFQVQILQEYLDVVILRDAIERHGITNTVALRRMVRQILNAPATPFSVHRLYNDLKSQGVAVGKDALYAYLDYLCDAYLLVAVDSHTASERVRQTNPRKVYPIDPGLIVACQSRATPDLGALLETAVCIELRRRGAQLAYVRTSSGHEVDFLARIGKRTLLVQVCADLADPATRERELRALREAMLELRPDRALVVTLHDDEHVTHGRRELRVLPFWRWALQLDA